MACPGSFPSSHGDPKLCWEVDPDKPGCTTSCLGGETDKKFLHSFFWIFVPDPQLFKPTLEFVVRLAPVEHLHISESDCNLHT